MTITKNVCHLVFKVGIAKLRRGDIHRQLEIAKWLQIPAGAAQHELPQGVDQSAGLGNGNKRIRR